MIRYNRRTQIFAVSLSMLAGFVDALGFISLGGFFVSFMSGNSTRLGVGLAQGSAQALIAVEIIATFVLGAVLGFLVGHVAGRHRRTAVLTFVCFALIVAACLSEWSAPHGVMLAMALAMGAENAVFARDGDVSIGLTYMTGALVKMGQRVATALLGGDRLAWLPYLLLWVGLVTGVTLGALVHAQIGMRGLWIAAAVALALALIAMRLRPNGDFAASVSPVPPAPSS
jgi:uncharacterized membrane protein YoaK (UPF0700 family)